MLHAFGDILEKGENIKNINNIVNLKMKNNILVSRN